MFLRRVNRLSPNASRRETPDAAGPVFRRQTHGCHRPAVGAALVLTLLILALLSGLIVAYFSRAMINRQIAFSSASQERAEAVAEDALQIIIGDLRSEMSSGSVIPASGQTPMLLNPTVPQTMVPWRPGTFTGMNTLVKWSGAGIHLWPGPNTTPSSKNYATAGPVRAASGNLTTAPAVNGRFVDVARWNVAQLMSTATPAASTNPPWPPSWVVLTRAGPLLVSDDGNVTTTQIASLANLAASNATCAVGRYAYTIYDEGALIDMAAGGFPSNTATAASGRKGSQGYADLTQLGLTQAQVDALVQSRNAATYPNYAGYLGDFARQFGFMIAARGDSAFVNRRDLINYCTLNFGAVQAAQVLPWLTTFSRESNAPSWGPLANASDLGGNDNGINTSASAQGSTIPHLYAYKDNANKFFQNSTAPPVGPNGPYVTNPFIPGIRVIAAFTRLDGTQAAPGEPLVKNRFDLSKLAWITHDGTLPSGVSATDVYHYFGLTRDVSSASVTYGAYVYNHASGMPPSSSGALPSTSRILTLTEVATANREPDFFELLQAGILQGSLGEIYGDPTQSVSEWAGGEFWAGGSFGGATVDASGFAAGAPFLRWPESAAVNAPLVYAQEKYQIMQIGANLIDQVQPDSFPTEISLNGQSFYGLQNLPYLNAIGDAMLRPLPYTSNPTLNDKYAGYVHRWLTFSLWNPNQNAANPPTTGPGKFRLYASDGEVVSGVQDYPGLIAMPPPPNPASHGVRFQRAVGNAPFESAGPAWLGFNYPDATNYPGNFSEPTTISYAGSTTSPRFDPTGGANINEPWGRQKTTSGWNRAGLYLGWSLSLDVSHVAANKQFQPSLPYAEPTSGTGYGRLSWTAPITLHLQYFDAVIGRWRDYQALHRFAYDAVNRNTPFLAAGQDAGTEGWQVNLPDPRTARLNLWSPSGKPDATVFLNASFYGLSVTEGSGNYDPPTAPPFNAQYASEWVYNDASSGNHYYLDRDAVDRLGDSGHWSSAPDPLARTQTSTRPVILNRPFQNVAEMGYACRDQPWKSLNLSSWSPGSRGSADGALLDLFCVGSPSSGNQPPPAVVAGKVDLNNAPAPVLQALIAGANRNAQTNVAGFNGVTASDAGTLAAAVAAAVAKTPLQNVSQIPATFPQDSTLSQANPGIKIQREAMVRALTGSTGTRTWNLLIDVIAQAGRYKPNPSSLNDFIVEGEKRYWLHVAIDRFTGKIIDQILEPVYE